MRRRLLLLFTFALFGLAALPACSNFTGPRATRDTLGPTVPRDAKGNVLRDAQGNPLYNIDEQQRRGRERLTISEDDFRIGPKGYIDRPSPTGR